MKKIIWMCWLQGEKDHNMPLLNRECIKKWKKLNSDWKINILSNDNIKNYVPEYFEIIKNSPRRTNAARSDLLRLLLLSKYGGVWVDASVYPTLPLSQFYDEVVNETGFFTYRFKPSIIDEPVGNRETVSWFLCVKNSQHYLIEKWKENFIKTFKNSKKWKYYSVHNELYHLYQKDNRIKHIINNMVQVNATIPHSALINWEDRVDSFVYKRPKILLKSKI